MENYNEPMEGALIKSKLNIHKQLTTWRIIEITISSRTNKKRYYCKASHDTKQVTGFDAHYYEFIREEFDLV